MLRQHCDRCDKLVDECPTWVEDHLEGHIWHVEIHTGAQHPEQMFCRACRIVILDAMLRKMCGMKATGGHLLNCTWDDINKRYWCADGCEIKKINEGT